MTLAINEVHEGDCLELMKDIPDKSVDMILCDLPYGTTSCKWDTVIPFEPLWAEYERVIKDNGAIVLTASQPFTSTLIMSNIKHFKYCWVWDKKTATGGQNAKIMPMKAHEDICVFSKGKTTYYPQMEEFTEHEIKRQRKKDAVVPTSIIMDGVKGSRFNISKGWYQGKKKHPKSVIRINGLAPASQEKKDGRHPTQKPVTLFEYLILTYSNEGDVVLDNCIGSGTTAIAAINTNRNYIGIEQDAGYVVIARQRISDAMQTEVSGEIKL